MARLAVIGVGRIGGEVAYLSASLGIVDELVLYDSAPDLLRAQVLDLEHTGLQIPISTDTSAVREADICIFSAGVPRNPSVKTRADLLETNLSATRDGIALLKGFSGILVTVTNPMDANNFVLCKKSGIARERCIGFGGQLDSARFGLALRNRGITGFPFVLGEHGEHQVPLFSSLASRVENGQREEILAELRGASMEIIKGKGGTVFGPALHLTQLTRIILRDARELIACSAVLEGEYGLSECSLGVPARVGRNGIRKIEEWDLDAWETAKMNEAGQFVKELCTRAVS
ncbi:MAG TPA: lactate dehydrogenase [Methanoregula sp.]|nr:lactate dehydrogenase [Methanoregula sp.]